jgi:hypothetical protein
MEGVREICNRFQHLSRILAQFWETDLKRSGGYVGEEVKSNRIVMTPPAENHNQHFGFGEDI